MMKSVCKKISLKLNQNREGKKISIEKYFVANVKVQFEFLKK